MSEQKVVDRNNRNVSYFRAWGDETMAQLPVKGDGRTVMTSDFVTVIDGIVKYNDAVWDNIKDDPPVKLETEKVGEERARRAGVILDTSKDGYYTTDLCIPDFEKVHYHFYKTYFVFLCSYGILLAQN